jgi:hypothetical protein
MRVCSESASCKACEGAKNGVLLFVNEYFCGERNTANGTLWKDTNIYYISDLVVLRV